MINKAFCFLCFFFAAVLFAETAMVDPLSQTVAETAQSLAAAPASSRSLPAAVAGIWENSSRFVEFSADGRMRIILKPYYGFVYEDTGWIPCTETDLALAVGSTADAVAAPEAAEATGAGVAQSPAVHRLAIRYEREKSDQFVPLAVVGSGMYFRFFTKYAGAAGDTADVAATLAANGVAGSAAGSGGATVAATGATGTLNGAANTTAANNTAANGDAANGITDAAASLSGFWLASGNADALRIWRSEESKEFFSYYFSGNDYWRIRYWLTDARERAVNARFPGPDGSDIQIPKFIRIGELLYTCITSTGSVLRNYERGTWSVREGKLSFAPANVVYAGTAAAYREPLACTLSADGSVLAFGAPYLVRSKIADLDAEITAHNGLRRPPRKPVFGYMELDFRWDEIEKIRNNGRTPASE